MAEENDLIKLNPARAVKQRKEDNGRVRYLTDTEEVALRKVITESYNEHLAEFELALMTGMRQGEQFSRTWDDVDLNGGLIRLQQTRLRHTKNGQSRFVPLNSRAVAVLGMLRDRSLASGRVFSIHKPKWFTKAVQVAGIKDFSWHCLRHTFASRLVMAGVDIRTVQELMGHKSITMTMRYAHLSPAHRLVAVEKLCKPTATTTATSEISTSVAATQTLQ